jgi:hypothetical protein
VVQGIAGAFAFENGDELLLALLEAAQDGVGDLAVHLDVAFAGEGVVAADVSRRTLFRGNMAPTAGRVALLSNISNMLNKMH